MSGSHRLQMDLKLAARGFFIGVSRKRLGKFGGWGDLRG